MFITRYFFNTINNMFFHNYKKWSLLQLNEFQKSCTIINNFITINEENMLLEEIEPQLKRLRYEKTHWDDAIYLYREREQRNWSKDNAIIIERIQNQSFPLDLIRSDYIHILDLHQDGYIRPHIDSKRYCGEIISGLSLLSDCVMRLKHQICKELIVDLLLKRRSLYKLSDLSRHEFTHEILSSKTSFFSDQKVKKDRRISIICRDIPKKK